MDRIRRQKALCTLALVWLSAALAAGCGGRDPLLGDIGPGAGGLPGGADAAAARDAGRDGTGTGTPPVMNPPVAGPDAGGFSPPAKLDAGPVTVPGISCVLPPCLLRLRASCTPAGTCVVSRVRVGQTAFNNICYANGVSFVGRSGSGRAPVITVVTRPDGSTCYSRDVDMRGAGVNAINYRGPMGELVATATIDRGGLLAVTCTGQATPQIIPSACEPGVSLNDPTMCTSGPCM